MTGYADTITISKANPLRWVHNDGQRASFDNTLLENESFAGVTVKSYCHKFVNGDEIPIQLKLSGSGSGNEVIVMKWVNGTGTALTATGTTVYTDFTIYEYLLTVATGDNFYLTAYTDNDSWTSETVDVEASLTNYAKLEWFNYDPLTNNESFEFDYQTTQAQASVNFCYIKSNLFEYSLSGERSVFDNQEEKVILRRSIFRRLKFETDIIPRWEAEKLAIAMSHDVFVVNDVAFTCEEDPSIERAGKSNMVIFNAVLTQKSVLGLNTHDIGFDCETMATSGIINLTETGSGAKTFAITDDYLILSITGVRTAGSPVITAGTTPGGTDVLYGMSLSASNITEVATVGFDKESLADGNLYITISGSGATATIHVLTLKNRQ